MVEPRVILLDEPLSALDPGFREDIRLLLKHIHKGSGITFLMVTHDFSEALTLATKAAIMNEGAIMQTGSVQDIFQRPSSSFVADFVGMKNVFPALFNGSRATVGGLPVDLPCPSPDANGYIALRPEDIVISMRPWNRASATPLRALSAASSTRGFSTRFTSAFRRRFSSRSSPRARRSIWDWMSARGCKFRSRHRPYTCFERSRIAERSRSRIDQGRR
jgi:molybdate/tungstate transport system ATP-binding protein